MHIVILGSAHPFRGGLASYNERLASEFQLQGHSVELYTFSLQYPGFLFPGKTQYSDSPPPPHLTIKQKVNSVNPFNWIEIGFELKKLKPDLLIFKFWLPFMGPCFGTIGRIAKRNNKTSIVTILDNVIPHEPRPGDVWFTKYFLKCSDAFIAMSESVQKDLKKFESDKTCILNPHPLFDNFGNAVSKIEAKQVLGLDTNQNYLLFFGFIRDYKGLDLLLQAMSDPGVIHTNCKLIVAGEFYSDSKPYLDLIEKHSLANRIVLRTDFISDEQVKYYFCAADMVVQPYKHATQSGVTQICYHFNKPMLVTNVGGLAEIVPHQKAGYVIEVKAEEIAKAIVTFYVKQEEVLMVENIKQLKQRFSWKAMVTNILTLCKKNI